MEETRETQLKIHHHRNGMSGLGFDVALTPNDELYLKFDEDQEHPFFIPLSIFKKLVKQPLVGEKSEKSRIFDPLRVRGTEIFPNPIRTILCAFDQYGPKCAYIGVYCPELSDAAFACFEWNLICVGEVRFGYNSKRGDNFIEALQTIVDFDSIV